MNIQIACLCDAATDYQGKLNLLGTFDTIFTRKLPAIHPSCAIVLRVIFSRMEVAKHRIRIDFVDEDGKAVIQALDLPFEIRMPPGSTSLSRNFIVNLQQIKLEKAGSYSVDVAINDRHEVSIPLTVRVVGEGDEPTPPQPH
ncbi:MAG: hypothetical protein R6X19_00780 [Kiritimatiellia bacterium]